MIARTPAARTGQSPGQLLLGAFRRDEHCATSRQCVRYRLARYTVAVKILQRIARGERRREFEGSFGIVEVAQVRLAQRLVGSSEGLVFARVFDRERWIMPRRFGLRRSMHGRVVDYSTYELPGSVIQAPLRAS